MSDITERVAKLLNQAENAGTEDEAAVFMAKAQALATTHSIDLARARYLTKSKQKTMPVQRSVTTGVRKQRGLRTLTDLFLGVAMANDIRCLISHDATVVHCYGFAEDIDMAEALFASLSIQMAVAVEAFKSDPSWREERVWSEARWEYVPTSWVTARLNFQMTYASRIRHRLQMAKLEAETAANLTEAERASRRHLDEDGALTAHFKAWFLENHGLDLDDEDPTAIEMTEAFRTVTERNVGLWYVGLLTDYFLALDDGPGTALVLAAKTQAIDEFSAEARARARGNYRGHKAATQSLASQAAGIVAAQRANISAGSAIGEISA